MTIIEGKVNMKEKTKTVSHRRLKKVCIIITVTVLSYVLSSMAASVVIFNVIFSRSGNIEAYELTYEDIDREKYPREELYFDSGGNKLFACLYEPNEKSSGLIVLANGMNCCIDRHLPEIMYFVDSGYSVFTFENTGVGHSDGSGTKGIAQARLDLCAAIEFVQEDSELSGLPLLLYGHSLGGYAVTAAMNDEDNICAVVCVAGFDSPNENMLNHAKRYVGVLADIQYPFMCLQNYFLFGSKADDTAIDAINSTDIPVMLVGGNSDDVCTDDISILGKAGSITNPNAVIVEITEEYRGEHNSIWLSRESAKYLYETDSPDDKSLANKLDENYMKSVIDFYESSIKKK